MAAHWLSSPTSNGSPSLDGVANTLGGFRLLAGTYLLTNQRPAGIYSRNGLILGMDEVGQFVTAANDLGGAQSQNRRRYQSLLRRRSP